MTTSMRGRPRGHRRRGRRHAVKRYGATTALAGVDLEVAPGRVPRAARSVRLGQVDPDPLPGRDRAARRRARSAWPAARHRRAPPPAAGAPQPGDGVPGLRPVAAPDRRAERRVRAARRKLEPASGDAPRDPRRARAGGARRHWCALPARTVRGRAAAGRARPGGRRRAGAAPVRRAAVQPRRRPAGTAAGGDRHPDPGERGHRDLHHARPDRGVRPGRHDRRARPG